MTESASVDTEWDAGDLGCGPLVLDLRKRPHAMPGGVGNMTSLDAQRAGRPGLVSVNTKRIAASRCEFEELLDSIADGLELTQNRSREASAETVQREE